MNSRHVRPFWWAANRIDGHLLLLLHQRRRSGAPVQYKAPLFGSIAENNHNNNELLLLLCYSLLDTRYLLLVIFSTRRWWQEPAFGHLIKRTMCIREFCNFLSISYTYALIGLLGLMNRQQLAVCMCVCLSVRVCECSSVWGSLSLCASVWKTISSSLFVFLSNNKEPRAKQFRYDNKANEMNSFRWLYKHIAHHISKESCWISVEISFQSTKFSIMTYIFVFFFFLYLYKVQLNQLFVLNWIHLWRHKVKMWNNLLLIIKKIFNVQICYLINRPINNTLNIRLDLSKALQTQVNALIGWHKSE